MHRQRNSGFGIVDPLVVGKPWSFVSPLPTAKRTSTCAGSVDAFQVKTDSGQMSEQRGKLIRSSHWEPRPPDASPRGEFVLGKVSPRPIARPRLGRTRAPPSSRSTLPIAAGAPSEVDWYSERIASRLAGLLLFEAREPEVSTSSASKFGRGLRVRSLGTGAVTSLVGAQADSPGASVPVPLQQRVVRLVLL
jgi:hypothetical protein